MLFTSGLTMYETITKQDNAYNYFDFKNNINYYRTKIELDIVDICDTLNTKGFFIEDKNKFCSFFETRDYLYKFSSIKNDFYEFLKLVKNTFHNDEIKLIIEEDNEYINKLIININIGKDEEDLLGKFSYVNNFFIDKIYKKFNKTLIRINFNNNV